jgi:hypothetical protein
LPSASDNAALRRLARAAIEFAQHVSTTPTRREAGIALDAVIQLADLLLNGVALAQQATALG